MNNQDMLDFLMEHDVILVSLDWSNNNAMTADEAFKLGGEFVVYEQKEQVDLYRGTDFDKALEVLEGKDA